MSGAAGLPAWYWERGLHDAQLLSAELQDDTLTLRLDSRSALFDNTVSQITFLGARLKTPLPFLVEVLVCLDEADRQK